jgi:hypothetical protein
MKAKITGEKINETKNSLIILIIKDLVEELETLSKFMKVDL